MLFLISLEISVHPGDAKDKMVNASLVAMEIDGLLPKGETPADTEDREASIIYAICREMLAKRNYHILFEIMIESILKKRKQRLMEIEKTINDKYGLGTVKLKLQDQYKNMAEIIKRHPEVLEKAEEQLKNLDCSRFQIQ